MALSSRKTASPLVEPAINVDYLLLGGGVASATAAATLRLEGAEGSIAILSAESLPPYYRPQLSKRMLLGDVASDDFHVHSEAFYREQEIDLRLNAPVTAVDATAKTVTAGGIGKIGYGRLLIATGGRPAPLLVPGAQRAGVHYLGNKSDSDALRQAAAGARRAAVIGGSFLGVEVAVALAQLGLGVTLIEEGDRLLPDLEAQILSDFFLAQVEKRGVTTILGETPVSVEGDARVRAVVISSGRRVSCDLVVVCVGLTPSTGFLRNSGVVLHKGLVVVDEMLQSCAPDVFAAGDVASFYDPVFARRRHIEHLDNARKQGQLAARNMMGQRLRYDEVSLYYCDVGDISFTVVGAPEEGVEKVSRGALEQQSFALFYLKDSVPRALFSMGRPADETLDVERLIRYRVHLGKVTQDLSNPGFLMKTIPSQTVLVLQGGGVLGAFECGVVKALEEARIFPDIVAGVSIAALNGAIVAANPRKATRALEAFWSRLASQNPFLPWRDADRSAAATAVLLFGLPNFFTPRWMQPFANPSLLPTNWTSFYDTAPLRALIADFVDFAALKASPVRLLVSAVNVATAELEVFDSYVDDLTPDHLMASGSLPPGFPWTMIGDKAYWDGGIVSNSPLDMVVDRCGPAGKRVFVVDLFATEKALPTNMIEVMTRREEIVYSERARSDFRLREMASAYRTLVNKMLAQLDPAVQAKIKQRPAFIELMGDGAATTITRFVRAAADGESLSRDYDFSEASIRLHQRQGYDLAKRVLHDASARRVPAAKPGKQE